MAFTLCLLYTYLTYVGIVDLLNSIVISLPIKCKLFIADYFKNVRNSLSSSPVFML